MSTYVKLSVNRPTRAFTGTGGDKAAEIILVDPADILTFIPRDARGIIIPGSHIFRPGTYGIRIGVTQDSISAKATTEGNPDSEGVIHEIVFAHPGLQSHILEFRSNWLHRDAIIFIRQLSTNVIHQYGDRVSPLRMQYAHTDSKDENRSLFTFKQTIKGPDVAIYQGNITLEIPIAVVPANATSINLAPGDGQYQLTTGGASAVVIATCTNGLHDQVFTLLGSGGAFPSAITSTGDFILFNGNTWTASLNAQITFRVFRSAPTLFRFIEISRS